MPCCGGRKSSRRSRGRSRVIRRKKLIALSLSTTIIALCKPDFYGIKYKINPWMDIHNDANHDLAVSQWQSLKNKLTELGINLWFIKPRPNLPDMVFAANAGLLVNDTFILSNFRYAERKGEEVWFRKFFEEQGYKVIQSSCFFEGAGDALFLSNHLVCGYGFRSDLESYSEINYDNKLMAELIDPHFYHLDTCFCPLQDGQYLIFPEAFSQESLNQIRSVGNEEIIVPKEEALKFACNAVLIGRNVILPDGCPQTMTKLEERGYTPRPLDMSEFIKAGGACKCLTLKL